MVTTLLWIPATILAGALQAWRTAVQRRASQNLSVNGAGFVRYLYGLPVTIVLLTAYRLLFPEPMPAFGAYFLPFCIGAGIAQILATNLLIMAFAHRNFVVGTAYSKTEAVQGALLSMLLLGEHLSLLTWLGIGCGVVGVMILSTGGKRMGPVDFLKSLSQPAALYGIASGSLFALTAIGVRRATQEIATPQHVHAALIVLVVTVTLQTMMQGGYLLMREPREIRNVLRNWRLGSQVGILSSVASACWFSGFATAPTALVRIVGQVEVLFTMALGHFYLREKMARSEAAGLLLVAAGVVTALAGSLI
ncbi:MAG: EamA family transporter [Sphingobium sp.]